MPLKVCINSVVFVLMSKQREFEVNDLARLDEVNVAQTQHLQSFGCTEHHKHTKVNIKKSEAQYIVVWSAHANVREVSQA